MLSRRKLLMASAAVVPAVALTNCSQPIDVITTVTQFLEKVQEGVVEACQASGKWVPTVDFIMETVVSVIGAAVTIENLSLAVAAIKSVIDAIAKQCPMPTGTDFTSPKTTSGKNKWY